jgi:hypothetical protein
MGRKNKNNTKEVINMETPEANKMIDDNSILLQELKNKELELKLKEQELKIKEQEILLQQNKLQDNVQPENNLDSCFEDVFNEINQKIDNLEDGSVKVIFNVCTNYPLYSLKQLKEHQQKFNKLRSVNIDAYNDKMLNGVNPLPSRSVTKEMVKNKEIVTVPKWWFQLNKDRKMSIPLSCYVNYLDKAKTMISHYETKSIINAKGRLRNGELYTDESQTLETVLVVELVK